ncbi:MAG: hypothetical protein ACR2KC_02995 [Acidimicrobiales bacterium]
MKPILGLRERFQRRDEAGFAGGAEALLFGLLLFVTGTLLVAYAWNVVDTKSAVVAAAREGARSFVEAPNPSVAAPLATQAAEAAIAGYGRDPSRAQVAVTSGAFARCARITITVRYPLPLVVVPFLGHIGGGGSAQAVHSELVDPYRSGLAGSARCG